MIFYMGKEWFSQEKAACLSLLGTVRFIGNRQTVSELELNLFQLRGQHCPIQTLKNIGCCLQC
jgi:hypothetical protein